MEIIWFIPIISSLIGWLTNYIAIRMLFRPHKEFRLGPVSIQGLIPKRKDKLAMRIAETVEVHLFNAEDITKAFGGGAGDDFRSLISRKIDDFIEKRLFSFNPMIASFVNGEIKESIKEVLVNEILSMIPSISNRIEEIIEKGLNIKEIVYQKISDFDFIKLEEIILSIASRELKAIELWGAMLGFIIGCFQLFLISM